MELRVLSADFSAPVRGSGPRTATQAIVFPRAVQEATSGLAGYTLAFAGDDHHVGKIEVRLDTAVNGNVVEVTATLGLRDWSGDWDDNYQGNVQFAVLAELVSATEPPPRGDLIVTGMEFNQAVQFFRAASYLDAQHALPDNSIRMVARKDTGVRVYVDYDASAGLPAIRRLTGNLRVEVGGATLDLPPINPGQGIVPRHDSLISMSDPNNTLNFMIPGAWCAGSATLTCQVWDRDAPDPKSAAFERTAVFTDVRPLNIYVVGVEYTAVDPSLDAPTQADFTSQSLPRLVKTYPVGDVVQSGFNTIAFGETVTGLINGGCTDGFSDLLDRLGDLRGGSSDIYVGVLPAGIVNTPGNQIGGCGRGGLAAVFLDLPDDLPHEVGHAEGRQHAPCTMNRCNPAPANADGNYPQYGTFPSDSIGVFGFDPSENKVFDPASTFDFMAYSFPQWVSAYTYSGLAGASFPPTGGPGSGGGGPIHLQEVYGEYLHLGFRVARDRTFTRRSSFHHPGYPHVGEGDDCGLFTLEILDKGKEVLYCSPLSCDCDGGCDCWPKSVRQTVPWPEGAARLRVWEDRDLRYEEEIPDPPRVRITGRESGKQGVTVKWAVRAGAKADLWYVVHWWDRRAGVWRGVVPRQQETSALVPGRLFDRGVLCIRVLATSGIATGFAEEKLRWGEAPDPGPDIIVAGPSAGDQPGGGVVSATVVDAAGAELPSARLTWYDAAGAEIGRGSRVDIRRLAEGQHSARVVYRGGEDRMTSAGVAMEVDGAGRGRIIAVVPSRHPVDPKPHPHPHPAPEPPEPDCFDAGKE